MPQNSKSRAHNLLIITQKVDRNDPVLGFFCKWIEKFAHHFEKVEVIALEVGEYKLPSNVSVHSLGKNKKYNKFHQFLSLQSAICNLQYDAVFVHMNPEHLALFGWYWRLRGKRIALWYTHKSVTRWLRVAEKFADKIFTASKESFRLPSKKVEIVGHGIYIELFQPITKSYYKLQVYPAMAGRASYKLLSVGRITPSKDLETIIRAVRRLRDQNVNAILDIVGAPVMGADFEYEKVLRELARNLNLEDSVKFLGSMNYEELPEVYRNRDLFIHTSKTGSVDKVVLESLASGTPVISSSEAFHDLLPENFRFRENDADNLAEKIKAYFDRKSDIATLISQIRSQNDLKKLIEKISDYLNS